MHFSSEYAFDGAKPAPYTEDDPVAPVGAYGASKAAGDLVVGGVARHYVVRPTWVVRAGRNFVRTMLGLAAGGVQPTVVADQIGRPTFADDLAAAVVHLLSLGAPFGTYHVTGNGEPASWAEVARATYAFAGRADLAILETSTAEYRLRKPGAAPRPLNSVSASQGRLGGHRAPGLAGAARRVRQELGRLTAAGLSLEEPPPVLGYPVRPPVSASICDSTISRTAAAWWFR